MGDKVEREGGLKSCYKSVKSLLKFNMQMLSLSLLHQLYICCNGKAFFSLSGGDNCNQIRFI